MSAISTEDSQDQQQHFDRPTNSIKDDLNGHTSNKIVSFLPANASSGYYDAEKCRAYIAKQVKVSKIDRSVAQLTRAIEVESCNQDRLSRLIRMYTCYSTRKVHDFTMRCKVGLQRHRHDRILNSRRKVAPNKYARGSTSKTNGRGPKLEKFESRKQQSINADLLYGPGVQLVRTLLTNQQSLTSPVHKSGIHTNKSPNHSVDDLTLREEDYSLFDQFSPNMFARHLENILHNNLEMSKTIAALTSQMGQVLERLATEHQDQVNLVYVAEEERQAATVTRRSAYNLSVAAFKATTTPVHVNCNNDG